MRAHGIRGEVAVKPLTDFVDRFEALDRVILDDGSGAELKVRAARIHKNQVLILFEGIESRTAAEKLVNKFLSVTKADLVDMPKGTYFQFEILGMKVVSEDGALLGEIREIIPVPGNDVWRVVGERELMIPASANVIMKVDKENKKVTVRLIEGLIDQAE